MTCTIDQMIASEVLVCVSSLVSTLAQGYGSVDTDTRREADRIELSRLAEQAFELAAPVDDWEEAAIENGWIEYNGRWFEYDHDYFASPEEALLEGECSDADTAQEACEANYIEPYQAEVFEHWAVTDWLADKLEAAGEKIDRDFAGLNVWGRTTPGQQISADGVIQRIYAETHTGLEG